MSTNNIFQLTSKSRKLAMILSKSNNARLRKYAMRIKNSSLKILIDDNDVNIKAINCSQLRFDPIYFHHKKKGMILNLTKNISDLQLKYVDSIFVYIHLPSEFCHVSELSQNIANLNHVWSLFVQDPDMKENIIGILKCINIESSNEIDTVSIHINAMLHVSHVSYVSNEFEENLSYLWEFYRRRYNVIDENDDYDCDYSIMSFDAASSNDYIHYLESCIHFYDLSNSNLNFIESFINQTHNEKLFSSCGTMRHIMK
jgi:hypothetical protein